MRYGTTPIILPEMYAQYRKIKMKGRNHNLQDITDVIDDIIFIQKKVEKEFWWPKSMLWKRAAQKEYECLQENNYHMGIENQLEAYNNTYEDFKDRKGMYLIMR